MYVFVWYLYVDSRLAENTQINKLMLQGLQLSEQQKQDITQAWQSSRPNNTRGLML